MREGDLTQTAVSAPTPDEISSTRRHGRSTTGQVDVPLSESTGIEPIR